MNSLEHILDISSAIERQKRGSVLNSILDTFFPRANKKPQEELKDNKKINEEIKINLFEKHKSAILEENDKKYNLLDSFIEYLSNLKENLYDYYSKAKDTLKKTLYNVGYTDKLLKEIESAPNFILILAPGSLDRCVSKDDWLRREIAHAIKTERNIIPMMFDGFQYPPKEFFPEDIHELIRHNGVIYSHDYHEATFNKLMGFLRKK